MPRSLSRSPSYRRRYSPSPVGQRHSRRSRRDRSRSPYSSAGEEVVPIPTIEAVRQVIGVVKVGLEHLGIIEEGEVALSPSLKSPSPSLPLTEHKTANEKIKKEEEEEKRRQKEAELKLLEEETAKRLEEAIRKNVEERLGSEEVRLEIERQIEEGRKRLFDDVVAQLAKEKEAALAEARQKEEQARKEREELDKMLEENRRRVEEAQRNLALELQRKEEERYRELELIQRQKEEAARRKKLEEEEEFANQMKIFGKNRSRQKSSSYGVGLQW